MEVLGNSGHFKHINQVKLNSSLLIMSSQPFRINTSETRVRLRELMENTYPGRGLVIGMTADQGHLVQVSWIMGRGKDSRNRKYCTNDQGVVHTDWANPAEAGDPALVIYKAMRESRETGKYVVSNGHQTDTVLETMAKVGLAGFVPGLADWQYEPDKPNYTPRITGAISLDSGWRADFSVLSRLSDGACKREHFYIGDLQPGYGSCLTTYTGDGNPLPSFTGAPYALPLEGSTPDEVADAYWCCLNEPNRVALAVKLIDIDTGVSTVTLRNKY